MMSYFKSDRYDTRRIGEFLKILSDKTARLTRHILVNSEGSAFARSSELATNATAVMGDETSVANTILAASRRARVHMESVREKAKLRDAVKIQEDLVAIERELITERRQANDNNPNLSHS